MTLISSFLLLAETYCRAAGIAEATLSSRMFRDGKRIGQIREGSDIGVRRLDVAVQWLSDNWPEGFDWPAGAVRPEPSTKIAEAAE